ncbi:MAG: helix-turn-helix domain-containing protein [Chloroflexi bacterium]|nr:helix-turn-helix domain-containing protein [Chloroflexota bacterium]MDA1240812.1 helix-turn-helix domain-containing protein [Chloroflexota bacterium]
MRGVALSDLHCSVARALDIVGERWTLLVLRDAFQGKRRFEEFSQSLPIARNVLASRLKTLVEHGILERRQYEERPPRFEYRLTDKGRDLYPVIVALVQWGDRYLAGEAGPPLDIFHRDCGGHVGVDAVCRGCGEVISARDANGVYRALPGLA